MIRTTVVLALALIAPACTKPGDGDNNDVGGYDGGEVVVTGDGSIQLTLGGLQPGWHVSTTRVTVGETSEATQVADGSDIVLTGTATDVFVATVTDEDGRLLATHSMQAPCTLGSAHQLHVPGDYATIQAAVDAASPGDTVKVAAGTYHEAIVMRPGVCLIGAGADRTVLDAQSQSITLVDLSTGAGSVVSGFTLRGVRGRPEEPQCNVDPFGCSGGWYRAGIYVSLLAPWDPINAPPPVITNNVFIDNEIALMLYFQGLAIVRNNVFVENKHALIANHFQERTLVANNVFWGNTGIAIGNQAAYLDLVDNIVARSAVATRFEHVQTGWIHCNLFFENDLLLDNDDEGNHRFTLGTDGNIDADPHFVNPSTHDFHLGSGSPGHDHGCYPEIAFEHDGSPFDVGVYGGPLAAATDLD
jgi:hypothetical protein